MTVPEDVSGFVTEYIALLSVPHELNGRQSYLPLGEPELDALARVYCVHLETVKADAVKAVAGAPDATPVDPRTLRRDAIHDHLRSFGDAAAVDADVLRKRIVRVVNVSTNHYQVHLPRPPTALSK